MKKELPRILIIILVAGIVGWMIYLSATRSHDFVYFEHLDDTAFVLDGNDYTYRDLAFYIAWEEEQVELMARVYNPKSTKDYWNMHLSTGFVQTIAKKAVLDMAVHDALMYKLAVEQGYRELSDEELEDLQGSIADFWMDLLDGQQEILLSCVTKEAVEELIYKKAIAEKYQDYLAVSQNHAYVYYDIEGDGYRAILKKHKLKVKKSTWDKLVLGDITLAHDHVSYINGYEGKKEKNEDRKK